MKEHNKYRSTNNLHFVDKDDEKEFYGSFRNRNKIDIASLR